MLNTSSPRLPPYVVARILTSLGGFLLRVDTGIIGPVTVMDNYSKQFGEHSSPVHGIVVSSILLSASISSSFAGWPADYFGRPKALAFGAAIFGLGAALQAGSLHLAMFITVYICEIAPPRQRGTLTTGPQFLICVGLVTGYFTCYATALIDSSMSWRLPFILLMTLSFIYAIWLLLLLPQSPRWLATHGCHADAYSSWFKLGIKDEDCTMLSQGQEPGNGLIVEDPWAYGTTGSAATSDKYVEREHNFLDHFIPVVRRRTTLAVFLMGMAQLSGIDAVLYYAPLLFQQAGLKSSEASFLASGVSGIVILAVSVPALLFADKWGRRTSAIIGGLGLTTTMILIAGLYAGDAMHAAHGAARWVVIVSPTYTRLSPPRLGPSASRCTHRRQSQRTRAKATSLTHGSWVCNFLVAFICPILLHKSSSGAYFLFGGCTALTTMVCFLFMIETKGKPLDEIEAAFTEKRPPRMGKSFGRGLKRKLGLSASSSRQS